MSGFEADFRAWIDMRVGRLEFELMSQQQRDLTHAAFMEGMYSKGFHHDAMRLANLPGVKRRMQATRDAAMQHREYLMMLLAADVDKPDALAMTIAFIQAKSLRANIKLPPEPKDDWQG